MEILAVWLFFSVIVGIIASNRGRSGFGWFLLACLLSPLIAVVIVATLAEKGRRLPVGPEPVDAR